MELIKKIDSTLRTVGPKSEVDVVSSNNEIFYACFKTSNSTTGCTARIDT